MAGTEAPPKGRDASTGSTLGLCHLFSDKGDKKLNFIINIFLASWDLLVDASVYILFGLLVAGLLRVFLNPNSVARHLGQGRFKSVIKSAFFGIPIPL
jgi:uncharacterized membrane protein YraQ (UPF0718 family)